MNVLELTGINFEMPLRRRKRKFHRLERVLDLSRFRRLPLSLIMGTVMLTVIVLVALFADSVAPYEAAAMSPADRLMGPSAEHLFGTDLFGRDLFSRVIYGARLSLPVAVMAVAIGAVPGILMGLLAGMYPGLLARIVSTLVDAWIAVPGLLVAIALTASFGRSAVILALALGLAGVPVYYRQARAESLRVSENLYVTATRSLGATEWHVLWRHILPGVMSSLLVLVMFRTGSLLTAISALSFIGLGAQPPTPEWGVLLAEGREYMHQAWWLTFFPGCAIAVTVLALNFIGDGLRDLLDPMQQ